MIYLASPYSSRDQDLRFSRFQQVREFAAEFLMRKVHIFSPIVYAHEMSEVYDLPTDALTWASFNISMLRRADALWVLQLDGWADSLGVQHELALAQACKIPTHYYLPNGTEVL